MFAAFVPLKKLRRNGRYLLFGAIVLVGVLAVYHEIAAAKENSTNPDADGRSWRIVMSDERVRPGDQPTISAEDLAAWSSIHTRQTWKPEFKGQANLHAFDDWCGSSTADLYKNLHYPLYPHSRTTVHKLAVTPQWTNYGLRIYGYLHPYADGDFLFAVGSDDNSELWLSTDDSPLNLQLLAMVGKTGREWTAPGEFEKYCNQISKPVWLSAKRRYFFEVIHKQNDRGTDHVEVAWRLVGQDSGFRVIESSHISLYANESTLLMSDVAHIPQTAPSHQRTPTKPHTAAADMLREDPRDILYRVPLINSKFLQGVLPDCSYRPSYTIKGFPLERYQGLQFVHMSYIYPVDYTRLTHMESEISCFYQESPYYMKRFGFSEYMKLDHPQNGFPARDFGFQTTKPVLAEENWFNNEAYRVERGARPDQIRNVLFPDYGDDYDDYTQKRRRKLFSLVAQQAPDALDNTTAEARLHVVTQPPTEPLKGTEPLLPGTTPAPKQNRTEFKLEGQGLVKKVEQIKQKGKLRRTKKLELKSVETAMRPGQTNPPIQIIGVPSEQQHHLQISSKTSRTHPIQRLKAPLSKKTASARQSKTMLRPAVTKRFAPAERERPLVRLNQRDKGTRKKQLRDKKEVEGNMPLQQHLENGIYRAKMIPRSKLDRRPQDTIYGNMEEKRVGEEDEIHIQKDMKGVEKEDALSFYRGQGGNFDGADDEDLTPPPVFDPEVNWSQTFQFRPLDLQRQRSDAFDLSCNVSGNLLLHSSDALPVVKAFMDKLDEKHHGQFTLVRVVNVVQRVDRVQGNRYLLELELKDVTGQTLRLSHYIYALIRYGMPRSTDFANQRQIPQLVLCNPVGFHWNPVATVHFIVPVKNQARWVLQLIADMEQLFRETADANFNLIIVDYNSTDMDVRKALEKSQLHRYQYVKLSGNFERSAGLQAGVDLIDDDHSIVFLCDLHIYFPPSIIDTIRKHCVEGYMAFAPVVMRLGCGATRMDARGYWEVNGFGLLGIYKSDLNAVGGMNTREYTDHWGGEDWELLDRILQAGLEVERIYLRNFFHHYHSRRGMWNHRMSRTHR